MWREKRTFFPLLGLAGLLSNHFGGDVEGISMCLRDHGAIPSLTWCDVDGVMRCKECFECVHCAVLPY
jgi:hypothetical protein